MPLGEAFRSARETPMALREKEKYEFKESMVPLKMAWRGSFMLFG
tara:strand:- start:10 stop:144 length:135 start_codon:yes stop_codon:yes gene_type:complete